MGLSPPSPLSPSCWAKKIILVDCLVIQLFYAFYYLEFDISNLSFWLQLHVVEWKYVVLVEIYLLSPLQIILSPLSQRQGKLATFPHPRTLSLSSTDCKQLSCFHVWPPQMSRIKGDKIALVGLVMYLFSTVYLLQMSPQSCYLSRAEPRQTRNHNLRCKCTSCSNCNGKLSPVFDSDP